MYIFSFMAKRLRDSGRRKRTTVRKPPRPRLALEALETRELLTVFHPAHLALNTADGIQPLGSAGPSGYTPAQVRHGYGFDRISSNGVVGDGSGQTIAIVDAFDNPNIANDLHQFDVQFGLPDPTFTKDNQRGGNTPPAADGGWAAEIALDVEWAHAIAPRANILLVEADDSSGTNLLAAVDFARRQPGVAVVSMSWGAGEFSNESSLDSNFTTPAGHTGVAFVASSGDAGAPPEWPAISANVLAVGGTSLQLDGAGNYQSETGWGGSGGGISAFLSQPAYQNGVVTQTSSRRASPDVAYDADPRTGVPVYDSFNNGTAAPWSQFGGTSAGSPQWAALVAIADQGRVVAGKAALNGPSQLLPMLYGLPSQDFHDVTAGTSFGQPNFTAGPGYDLVTGRGTPVANLVVADLVGTSAAAGVLQDAGFESPAVGAGTFQYRPAGTPWAFVGGAGVSGNGSGFTAANPNAPEGTQVGFLQGTGSFSQMVPGVAAGTYQLTFSAAQRANFQASRQDFQVLVDGVAVGTFTPSGTSYSSLTATFTVAAGSHTITFQGLDSAGGDNTAFIDNVRLTQAPAASLSDAGFESPAVGSGFQYRPVGTPWTFAGSAGVSGNGSGFTAANPNAPEGTQVGFLQGTGSFSQAVTGMAAGTYRLSFSAAQRANFQASRQDFRVLVDSVAVGTFTPSGTSYTSLTAAFTVTAGSHTITFQGIDSAGGDNTAFIDNVHLT